LFIFRGSDTTGGDIRPLYDGRNSLGRSDDRDIVLEDGRVSSEHGFLFIRPDRHTYVDTSTNGSRVDDKVVYGEQIEVKSGSVIEAGGLRLVIVTIPPEAMKG
jgi:pSer/pThr/pTyr-binding forkhead associated (FHA) protein